MTESDVVPFLTPEWRQTAEIARDVWDAEGHRGDFSMVRMRIAHTLSMMEKRGKAESKRAPTRGRPVLWRLAE